MRLVYLGTPEIAVRPLGALVGAGHDVALVVTRADRRRGRGGSMAPSPVKAAATDLGLNVTHDIADVTDADAELGVVVAYGRIIKPDILAAVPMLNMHFSLLPRWRGAAPVERAILAGDTETGVSLMAVEEELDTGAVYAEQRVPIGPRTTAAELRVELVELGTRMLVELLAGPLPTPIPQRGEPTYAHKIEPEELRLDWSRPAVALDRVVRVGGAWTTFRGRRLKIHRAAAVAEPGPPGVLTSDGVVGTGTGGLQLTAVQPEARGVMTWADFANGFRPQPGERLGDTLLS